MLIFHKNTNVALDFLKNYSFDVNFNISGKGELPDERLSSLLNIALMKGETNVILALLEFDEFDLRASDLSIYLLTQEISLHGNSKVVKAIMNHASFDPNVKSDDNTTLLMVATKFNKLDIVERLLKLDHIDLDLQDNKGNSALMYALKFGQDSILDLFFEHLDRINVNLENNKGISTLLFAILSLENLTQSKLNIASKMLDYEYLNVNTFYKVGYPIHLVRNYNLDDLAVKIMQHNTFDPSTLNYKADWDIVSNAVYEYWDQRKDVLTRVGSYYMSVGLSTFFIIFFALRNFRPLVYSIFQFFF